MFKYMDEDWDEKEWVQTFCENIMEAIVSDIMLLSTEYEDILLKGIWWKYESYLIISVRI